MTRLFNEPTDFADEAVDGFVAANSRFVRKVHGGVVRATASTPGSVALVIGGGSGHYPAFGGLVGQGLAHGAALGNVFASPSWQQVRSVSDRLAFSYALARSAALTVTAVTAPFAQSAGFIAAVPSP